LPSGEFPVTFPLPPTSDAAAPSSNSAPTGRTGVLLVNLGTPAAPTTPAVKRFLAQFLHDRRVVDAPRWWWCPLLHFVILPLRSPRAARNYASIWMPEGSPLMVYSQRLAQAMQAALPEFEVALAMRYGEPSIEAAMDAMAGRGVGRLIVLPLYPQYSTTTTASVVDAADAQVYRDTMVHAVIADYHLDDAWLDAVAASVRAHWDAQGRGEKLMLSFHGIPQRLVDRGDPYAAQCEASASAIAARLGLTSDAWQLTYQSRFGREKWLGPATIDTLEAWGKAGIRRVDVVCPGFATDCLETLEEIAMVNAAAFARTGGTLRYIEALNDSPAHVEALAALVRRTR
jgi:protoporphyrin/coproporphyrin ferrochelatase